METTQRLTDLVALAYLFYLAGSPALASGRRRTGLGLLYAAAGFEVPGAVCRLGLVFLGGLGLVWLLRAEPVLGAALAGGSIALAAGAMLRLRAGERAGFAAVLGLLERLERETAARADFFAALGAARGDLQGGPFRRAVDAALDGYARRLPLPDCLRPLAAMDPALAGLAADVRRAGWESSEGLRRAVGLVYAAAVRRWDRERAARVRLDRLEERVPPLRAFAAGAAAGGLIFSGSLAAAAVAGLCGLVWLGALTRRAALRRFSRLAGGAAALLILLPAAAGGPVQDGARPAAVSEPAATVSRTDRMPGLSPEPQPATVREADPIPDLARTVPEPVCRIATGVAGGRANVREAPSMAGRVAFHAVEGEAAAVLGEVDLGAGGAWARIRMGDGRTGWIYGPLCPRSDG
ncbi:MAG TPA: SH3 domain-containing protein [Anaerolineales bacterium]|nr:SH3 domain-containing protein [Anaerolineales bacterium]